MQSRRINFIVDSVMTWTLVSLCELVNVRLMEAQETNSLCYECKHIFGFYNNVEKTVFPVPGIDNVRGDMLCCCFVCSRVICLVNSELTRVSHPPLPLIKR